MDRRRFLLTSLAGALAAPLAGEGQQTARIARIGWLGGTPARGTHLREAFLQALRDLGYVEGRNLVMEYRYAEANVERFPALAAELAALKVDVIFASAGSTGALAAKQATRTIPIVFVGVPIRWRAGSSPALRGRAGTSRGCPHSSPRN